MSLELGDIITISAPSNTDLHDKMFLIEYLDEMEINIVDLETGKSQEIYITDGILSDDTIDSVTVVNEAQVPGYARQNNLLQDTWITVQFGGEIPMTVNGQITSLEEDMIEISTWPEGVKIYIDFEYKGLPKRLHIKKFINFTPPKDEAVIKDASVIDDITTDNTVDDGVFWNEETTKGKDLEEGKDLEGHDRINDTDITQYKMNMLFSADEVIFGNVLEELDVYVDVPEHEIRYGMVEQMDDLLNDALSTIPTGDRTRKVYQSLHIMIERYRELINKFSDPKRDGVPLVLGDNHKPLVDSLERVDKQLHWILPIVRNDKIIYDIDWDGDDTIGITNTTLAIAQESIYDINMSYQANTVSDGRNKHIYKHCELNPYLTPFKEPSSMRNVLINKDVGTTLNVVLNNNSDMESYALCGNSSSEYTNPRHVSEAKLKQTRFQMSRYDTGLTQIKPKDTKTPSVNTELMNVTPDDNMSIVGTLTLPESVIQYSQINLPYTSIYKRAVLNLIPFTYKKYLNDKTKFKTAIIEQDILGNNIGPNHSGYADHVTSYLFSENGHIDDRDSNTFREYLDKIVPATTYLFKLVEKHIIHSTSYMSILGYLQPFMIFPDNITYKTYEFILKYMADQITKMKGDIAYKRQKSIQYVNYKYKVDIGFKNSHLFNMLDSISIQERYKLEEKVESYYNIENGTTCEFMRNLLTVDNGRVYMSALAVDDMGLLAAHNIDDIIREKMAPKVEDGDGDEQCGDLILAKHYIDVSGLQQDNGETEVFFDKKYDETRYDIIEEFKDNQSRLSPASFYDTLLQHMTANVGLEGEYARREVEAIISGKRRVEKGDYAFIVDDVEGNLFYIRDADNRWNYIAELDGRPLSKSTFCNLKKGCISINDKCGTIETNKTVIKDRLVNEMLEQFNDSGRLGTDELSEILSKNLQYNIDVISRLIRNRTLELLQTDKTKKLLGDSVSGRLVLQSPHAVLRDLILSQDDFVSKQSGILKFIGKTCRPAHVVGGEDDKWFYCITSDIKLLPTFYKTLAGSFFSNSYEDTLNKIAADRGVISDDGDKIVDRYSGFTIRLLEFDEGEGYDETGYKVVTRAIMAQDRGDIIRDGVQGSLPGTLSDSTESKSMYTPDGEMIRNVLLTMSKYMDINIDSEINQIIHNVESILESHLYNLKKKKSKKKRASKTDIHDEALLLITLGYYLVITQTVIPPVKTTTTFNGCGPRSFKGYPSEGEGDYVALKYLCCVALKLKSRTQPWQSLPKLSVETLKKFWSKMKKIIDTDILTRDTIQDKIRDKLAYERDVVYTDGVPLECDVRQWTSFLPPLNPIKITGLQPLGPIFGETLKKELMGGDCKQFERLGALFGKITSYSLRIQEIIQGVVNQSTLLLDNGDNGLYMENSCCNDGNKNTVLYFEEKGEGILQTNGIVTELAELYNTVFKLDIPAYLHDFTNTKFQYPKTSTVFSTTTIYKAFIKFCRFNSDNVLAPELQSICGVNKSGYKEDDDIATKISILKSEGKSFSLQNFIELMGVVNRDNQINVNLETPVHSPRSLLEHYLHNDEIIRSARDTPLAEFISNTSVIIDGFDVLRGNDVIEDDDFSKYEAFLNENINTFTEDINHFLYRRGRDAKTEEIIANMDNWKQRGENIYMSKEDETAIAYADWSKNAIWNILKIFPTIIQKEVDFTTPSIPQHWKSGSQKLSDSHVKDIQGIIREEHMPLSVHYGNEIITGVLDSILLSREADILIELSRIIPIFTDIRLTIGKPRETTILNGSIIKKIMKYLTLYSISLYITATSTDSVEAKSHLEYELSEGKNEELNVATRAIIKSYLTIMENDKKNMNVSNYQINQDILKSQEKEKSKITKRLGDMCAGDRRIEDIMKNLRLGDWGVGQTKALFVYDASQYEKERGEMKRDTMNEMRAGTVDGVTERAMSIYNMDDIEGELESVRIQEALNTDLLNVRGEDEELGEEE